MLERLVVHYGLGDAMMYGLVALVVPLLLRLGVNIGHICRRLGILAGLLAMAQEVLKILYRGHV